MKRVELAKVKRPGGTFRFDLELDHEDDDGAWLYGAVGDPCSGPNGYRDTLSQPVVLLIPTNRPYLVWWIDLPPGRLLSVDIGLPAERTTAGWTFVDLELDPVRHEAENRVEIEDWDEFEEAVRRGWMTAGDADLARSAAEEMAERLRTGDRAWSDRGWALLDSRLGA